MMWRSSFPNFGEKTDLTYYPLRMFWVIGVHPKVNSKIFSVIITCVLLCYTPLFALGIKGASVSYQDDVYCSLKCIQTSIAAIDMSFKLWIAFSKKSTINNLLEERSKFLKVTQHQRSLDVARFFIIGYLIWTFFISFLYVQPYISDMNSFMYVPEGWDSILLSINLVEVIFGLTAVFGLNSLIWGLCVGVFVQFKQLGYEFKTMNFSKLDSKQIWSEIGKLVDYHNFLFRYCDEVNKLTGTVLLFTVIESSAAACLYLLATTKEGSLNSDTVRNSLCFGAQLTAPLVFCLCVELIAEASSQISDAVYESKWYETQHSSVRKGLVVVMVRARRQVILSGHGLVYANLDTFTKIFKTALSYYAYLNTMSSRDA